jgi:hypothetical protein
MCSATDAISAFICISWSYQTTQLDLLLHVSSSCPPCFICSLLLPLVEYALSVRKRPRSALRIIWFSPDSLGLAAGLDSEGSTDLDSANNWRRSDVSQNLGFPHFYSVTTWRSPQNPEWANRRGVKEYRPVARAIHPKTPDLACKVAHIVNDLLSNGQ